MNCSIEGNTSEGSGGGIHVFEGSVRMLNCEILNNVAFGNGGGILCGSGYLNVKNCLIEGNRAEENIPFPPSRGGGIICFSGMSMISNSRIESNSTESDGGGLYFAPTSYGQIPTSHTIINCIIAGNNSGMAGGAIGIAPGYDINYQNSIDSPGTSFSNNLTISNCTIVDNSAGSPGGAIGPNYDGWDIFITNSILWNNSPDEVPVDEGASWEIVNEYIKIEYCDIQGGWINPILHNIDADPMFIDSDYHIGPDSPCFDSGTSDNAPSSDIEGNMRPSGWHYDIGAYEFHTADTDGDGLLDGWEEHYFGHLGYGPDDDPDNDGLVNWDEGNNRTNPNDSDTDDDGWNDGDEVREGGNPLHPDNPERTYYVDNDFGEDYFDGLAPVWDGMHGPKKTIQAGIDATVTGWEYTVLVAEGIYTGDGNRNLVLEYSDITLKSKEGPEYTVIDCQATSGDDIRGVWLLSGDAVLDGFTVTGGNARRGAGIFCREGNPIVRNCTITGNKAFMDNGAGIFCGKYSSPTIEDCTITANSAAKYGGAITSYRSNPKIINCTITGKLSG